MLRRLIVFSAVAVLVAVDCTPLGAVEVEMWPDTGLSFVRGPGAYLSPWKVVLSWLLFLTWVYTTDWISQDAQLMKLRFNLWNPIAFFSFFVALILLWLLPWFAVGMLFMVIAWVAPLAAYVVYRNGKVPIADKVFTQKHIRRWMLQRLSKIGIKLAGSEEDDPRDTGSNIQLTAVAAATERENNVNLLTARQSLGWNPARELLDETLIQRATHVMLDFADAAVGVRYQIDGVWHDRAPMEPPVGEQILGVLKGIAALNVNDRRSRQSGTFGMQFEKDKYTCKITTQGTQSGERALIMVESKKLEFKSLDDLGMRAKMQEQLHALLDLYGIFVFTSLPANGLTTTMDVVLSTIDRFLRSFVTVSDVAKQDRDIENVPLTTFDAAAGESPATVLPKLVRTYPDVIVVRDVADLETLTLLCDQVAEKRTVIVSLRAKEAVESLLRLLMLKIPPADLAGVVTGALNVRLIRKLCEKCKEAYPPPPEVLKQLGLPQGRVENLYRTPTVPIDPKKPDVVCDECQGIGYLGRTAIFELLSVDDGLRQVLATAPKMENLRAAARKAKHRSLQEEGVLLVARGVTSLQELLRVLKQ
jgi:type II secretory ATPase GspE/PulE/Tfp pilus assembly ATPase PilB-like protein